jgi:hypothetical protein
MVELGDETATSDEDPRWPTTGRCSSAGKVLQLLRPAGEEESEQRRSE